MIADALIVLVVEDDLRTQDVRRRQLRDLDAEAIFARTREQALQEIEASPGPDAVLTDANLDEHNPRDSSGIQVARDVRDRFGPEIPIMAYSGKLAESPLTEAEAKELFTRRKSKGIMAFDDVEDELESLLQDAREYREQRVEMARARREEMRSRILLDTIEPAETVRRLLPDGALSAEVEGLLEAAGYHLQLVRSGSFKQSANPLLVWTRRFGSVAEAEVYGQPALYSDGDDEQDAVEKLVDLMRLFAEDFEASDEPVAGPAARLRAFLDRTMLLADGD